MVFCCGFEAIGSGFPLSAGTQAEQHSPGGIDGLHGPVLTATVRVVLCGRLFPGAAHVSGAQSPGQGQSQMLAGLEGLQVRASSKG
ncbi:MAG: hypothetical protein DCF24_00540 [Cyanobium sp.]|nr:MAG: hypothetical protein DCF24_00540 [Cyanobium sp.]